MVKLMITRTKMIMLTIITLVIIRWLYDDINVEVKKSISNDNNNNNNNDNNNNNTNTHKNS